MNLARHVMIRASAGSGKTYALTTRFVKLLAHGALPARIVALTFTRKAAGEFFDEILNKLAQAASEPAEAKKLAEAIELPHWGSEDFLRLLRLVIAEMPALRLGTLDGFFARIARSFPLELGLAGKFELLQEYGARMERERVLQLMFTRGGELNEAQKEFVEAFKRATFGREEKRLGAQLDAFLDDYQEKYLVAPEGAAWGNPRRIWPAGNVWLDEKPNVAGAITTLRGWLERSGQADKQRQRWVNFLLALETWRPGAPPQAELAYVLKKALDAWSELLAGTAVLEFDRKKQDLGGPACAALAAITVHLVGGELTRRMETTRGIHAVLRSYESIYDETVRRAGKLTFADVQRLLMPERAPALTGEAGAGDGRLYIDYRLDARIDHWLLDEFQDTSVGQWSVLRNLVDEVVQDPSRSRSFFCVGDVKQAIFTWREGDPRLFQEVLDHYNVMAPGTIAEEKLVESWRSGPALIEMVNAVFGDAAGISGLFPGAVAKAWNREWSDHRSAVAKRTGQAALFQAEDEAGRWQLMLELLREIRPLERGLTCVVLVQKNSTASELADYLRASGLPALAESDLHVCTDNPLGAALLALVQAAAHPGDTLAWEHVRMTPLGEIFAKSGIETPAALAATVLGQIHAQGFEYMIEGWLQPIEAYLLADDGFSRLRARQFAEAARLFDETGSRDVTEFIAFMERHTVRDAESASVIRVMTIHKSKGLGFDVVLLPDLEGRKLDQRRKGLAVQKNADRSIAWVLDLPNELFRQSDPVLSAHVAEAEAEAGYEALSLLYVAMTRAKRAMYAIIEPVGDSKSLNYPKVLSETLGSDERPIRIGGMTRSGVWMAGDPDWWVGQTLAEVKLPLEVAPAVVDGAQVQRAARHPARRASDGKQGTIRVAPLFVVGLDAAADFGAEVHRMLAEIEWLEPRDLILQEAKWRAATAVTEDAIALALACLRAAEMAVVWVHPNNSGQLLEVWRERAFELVLDGVWFTGVFDRVIVGRDRDGRVVSAWVIDFKTDQLGEGSTDARIAEKHATQINLYRRAAAVLTGLPVQQVRCSVALLAGPRLVDVSLLV